MSEGTKNDRLKSYIIFRLESRALRRLYLLTVYAYEGTQKSIKDDLRDGTITMASEFFYNNEIIARSPNEIQRKLSDTYRGFLRESLLVRLISSLEIFFGDTLREISNITTKPFESQKEKTYKVSELLSIDSILRIHDDILANEIRAIVLGGFKNIRKFFSRNLNVEFGNSGLEIKLIEQVYDIRNLIVHNNGNLDDLYVKKYLNGIKPSKKKITIDEDQFIKFIELILELATYVNREITKKFVFPEKNIRQKDKSQRNNEVRNVNFSGTFKEGQREIVLDEDFQFGFNEKFLFSEIQSKVNFEKKHSASWTVEGPRYKVGTYIGYIKRLAKLGIVDNLVID
ncbi:hypothetical protein MHB54_00890 [Paenibacillus sp. FSL M7-0802]|uniref:hypothetical protein n=1 Tax=Paenibacillus sp. FSL M7-0802 TaxID=2921536 RepID=UPI0030F57B9F